jgi:hypothetical protein
MEVTMDSRDEAAIRTALMLGATFVEVQRPRGTAPVEWYIEGLEQWAGTTKAFPAWMYLLTFGLCIDQDGKPCLCRDFLKGCPPEDKMRAYALVGEIIGGDLTP